VCLVAMPLDDLCAQTVETAAVPAVAKAAIREQLAAVQKALIEQAKKAGAAAKVRLARLCAVSQLHMHRNSPQLAQQTRRGFMVNAPVSHLLQAHAAEAAVREVDAAAGSGAKVAVFRLDVGLDAKVRAN